MPNPAHAGHTEFQAADQASLGTASTAMTQTLPYISAINEDVKLNVKINTDEFNGRFWPTRVISEYKQHKFSVETTVPYWGMDLFWKTMMGQGLGPTQQAATVAYKNHFAFLEVLTELFTANLNLGPQIHEFEGCTINKATLSGKGGEEVKLSLDCLANGVSFAGDVDPVNPIDIEHPEIVNFDHFHTGDDCGIFIWNPATVLAPVGALSILTGPATPILKDIGQVFTPYFGTAPNAGYAAIVYGDAGVNCAWGYCGGVGGSAAEVKIYTTRALSAQGWTGGTEPTVVQSYLIVPLPTTSHRINAKSFSLTIDNHLTDENSTAAGKIIPKRAEKSPEVTLELERIAWDEAYAASDYLYWHQNKTELRAIISLRGSNIVSNYYNELLVYLPAVWVLDVDTSPKTNGLLQPKITLRGGFPYKPNDATQGIIGEPIPLFEQDAELYNADISSAIAVVVQNRQSIAP